MANTEPEVRVIGGGGHAKVVIGTLRALGHDRIAVFDDDATKIGTEILGAPVVGTVDQAREAREAAPAILAIGDNRERSRLAGRLDLDWMTLVHPAAWVEPTADLGAGTVVFAGAIVQAESHLGEHVILNTGATIDHDSIVGSFAHIAPGAHFAGGVSVGDGALLGVGSTVLPGISIGAWATVGAGAVVAADVPAASTVAGVPARPRG